MFFRGIKAILNFIDFISQNFFFFDAPTQAQLLFLCLRVKKPQIKNMHLTQKTCIEPDLNEESEQWGQTMKLRVIWLSGVRLITYVHMDFVSCCLSSCRPPTQQLSPSKDETLQTSKHPFNLQCGSTDRRTNLNVSPLCLIYI